MKAWELEQGKVYVDQNESFYRISYDGHLEYKLCIDGKWEFSRMRYRRLMERNFEEYIEHTDWSKVEVGTKVRCRDNNDELWCNGYFIGIMNDKIWVSDEISSFDCCNFDITELFEWED